MAEMNYDDHNLFEDMIPKSSGTIRKNIISRLGLVSRVAKAIRFPKNNTTTLFSGY